MTDFIYVSGVGVLIAVVLLIIFGPPYYGYTLAYKPTRVQGCRPDSRRKNWRVGIDGWMANSSYRWIEILYDEKEWFR